MSVNRERTDELEIRGRMDIEDIVKYAINRCNVSSTDPNPAIFNSNVLVLLDNLPAHKRDQVLEKKKAYEETVKIDDRPIYCGVRVGPSKIKEQKIINYHLLYRVVLDAFAESGLTWNIEQELKELGKIKYLKTKPTPYLPDTEDKKVEQP